MFGFNLITRLHSESTCCQLGHTTQGSFSATRTTRCCNGVPTGREWFEIKVEVTGDIARIYRDGALTVQTSNHFTNTARCGIIVPNGYRNTVYFKDFVISEYILLYNPLRFECFITIKLRHYKIVVMKRCCFVFLCRCFT